jgi:hypothetical protein
LDSQATQLAGGNHAIKTAIQRILDNIANLFNTVVFLAGAQSITGKKSFAAVTASAAPINLGQQNTRSP